MFHLCPRAPSLCISYPPSLTKSAGSKFGWEIAQKHLETDEEGHTAWEQYTEMGF